MKKFQSLEIPGAKVSNPWKFLRRRCGGLLCGTAAVALALAGNARAALFSDDFEAGTGSWSTNGTWGLTTAFSVSPSHAMADSPGAFYTNNANSSLTMESGANLVSAVRPAVGYFSRYALESGYDFARLEISTNGGISWAELAAATGTRVNWQHDQVALTNFAGAADVRLRVRLTSDSSVTMDGIYIDDFVISEMPQAVSLFTNGVTPNSVALSWTASADPSFKAYRLERTGSLTGQTIVVVGEYGNSATTSAVDIAVSPKSAYYYRIAVVNSNDLATPSAWVAVGTPAGMDFPFLDNGESGGGTWVADGTWALDAGDAFSATRSWTDSPGSDYSNGVNSAITLSAPLNLTGSVRPVLSYAHRYNLLSGDNGLVEISTNNGAA